MPTRSDFDRRPNLIALTALAAWFFACGENSDDRLVPVGPDDWPASFDGSPGGSHCRGCVAGFQFGVTGERPHLDLCVHLGVRFIGSLADVAGETPARWIERGSWSILDDDTGARVCVNCRGSFLDEPTGTYATFRVLDVDERASERLRMVLTKDPTVLSTLEASPYPTVITGRVAGDGSCPPPGSIVGLEPRDGDRPDDVQPRIRGDEVDLAGGVANAVAHIAYDWPYGGVRSCSGILVAEDAVLTAAHCFTSDVAAADLRVTLGRTEPLSASGDGWLHAIDIIPHGRLDLAVVRLAEEATAEPARLAEPGESERCSQVVVHGYGVTDSEGRLFDWGRLRAAELEVVPELCVEHGCIRSSPDQLIMAPPDDLPAGFHGFCRGDSGGPIVRFCGDMPRVVGLAMARVIADDERVRSATSAVPAPHLERVGASFSFSRHNVCGVRNALGFAATRVDSALLSELATWRVTGES